MKTTHIMELFATNLRAAMERKYGVKPDGRVNQSEFAKAAEVNQKGISNYLSALDPNNKLNLDDIPSPTLTNLAKMATALGMQPWELLHPDINKAIREQELYRRIEREFRSLPKLDLPQEESDVAEKYSYRRHPRVMSPSKGTGGFFAGAGVDLDAIGQRTSESKSKNKAK